MRFLKNIAGLFISVATFATMLTACEESTAYDVNGPGWMQDKIDSIAAANNRSNGDTTFVQITKASVGATDCSSAWWTDWSQSFEIPAGKLVHVEFVNHTSGANNYNNWNLALVNVGGNVHSTDDDATYFEYAVIRSDAYGWGGSQTATYPYEANYLTTDYAEALGLEGDDMWAAFREKMQGAYVYMDIDHSTTGYTFVTATAVATDGTRLTESFRQATSPSDNVYAFLVIDGSSLDIQSAYQIPSKVTEIADQEPVSLTIEGAPSSIEIGNEDYWGEAVATVTFADGSSTQVEKEDLIFTVIPDITTVGEKTIVVTYNRTMKGNVTTPVSGYYKLNVTNQVVSIAVTKQPAYVSYSLLDNAYLKNSDRTLPFNAEGLEVTATYSDGTTEVIPNDLLSFSVIPATFGTHKVVVTHESGKTTETSVNVVKSETLSLSSSVDVVGAEDNSTGWWAAFSEDWKVPAGKTGVISFTNYAGGGNWNNFVVILRNSTLAEYAVVRADNFGWGAGYDGNANLTLSGGQDWATWLAAMNGAKVTVYVTNNGAGFSDVLAVMEGTDGNTYTQFYENISTVNPDDFQFALTVDGSHIKF